VYLAEVPRLHRRIPTEVLLNQPDDSERRDRFRREARATAALAHPNIGLRRSVSERRNAATTERLKTGHFR
jgi:hypothetical protein